MCIYKNIHPNKTFLAEAFFPTHYVNFYKYMFLEFFKKAILQNIHIYNDCHFFFHQKIQRTVAPSVQNQELLFFFVRFLVLKKPLKRQISQSVHSYLGFCERSQP